MAFVIPSIFTAVDKFSGPVKGMGRTVDSFVSKTEAGIARQERAFRKFNPILGEASSQLFAFAKTAAIAGAIISTGSFAIKSLMDYETEMANLSAITGASGKQLDFFKTKIHEVSKATGESSVEVTKAFTAIGNNQPQLLKDAEGLAMVTKASIILARASKMELGPAGEALTSIMNQYSISAKDAGKTIDQLAAASQAGSAEIEDVAASLQKFAPVAVVAGIKINESLALIESGSKFFKEGTETGTKFLNMITIMASLKVQDPKALADLKRLGVNMNIVTDKTRAFGDRLNELKKIGKDIPALFHVFGKENLAMAGSILNSTDRYNDLLKSIEETGKAQEMANKNNATLARSWEKLKAAFVNILTSSEKTGTAMNAVNNIMKFTARHLDGILKAIGLVVGAMILWWTWIKLTKGALIAMRAISSALFLVDMIKYVAATRGLTFAQAAWAIVTQSATDAMLFLNAAMLANPAGLILAGIILLIASIVLITKYWNEWGAAITLVGGIIAAFFSPVIAAFLFVISLVQSFRRNWDMIGEAFSSGGVLSGFLAIGKVILDAILMPLQQIMAIIAKFTGWDWAASAAAGLNKFRTDMGVNVETDESGNPLPGKGVINNKKVQNDALFQKLEQTNNAKVDINVNDPTGRTTTKSEGNNISVRTSSTMQMGASGSW